MSLVSPSRVNADGHSVGIAVLWCSYTHSGALLLHLIYCEGPTPFSAWCCHLQAEQGVSSYRHLVTTQPASNVAAQQLQLCHWAQDSHAFEVFLQFILAKWFCLKQSTLYRKHSQSMHFWFILRDKGRPWKITVASGSWLQMQMH